MTDLSKILKTGPGTSNTTRTFRRSLITPSTTWMCRRPTPIYCQMCLMSIIWTQRWRYQEMEIGLNLLKWRSVWGTRTGFQSAEPTIIQSWIQECTKYSTNTGTNICLWKMQLRRTCLLKYTEKKIGTFYSKRSSTIDTVVIKSTDRTRSLRLVMKKNVAEKRCRGLKSSSYGRMVAQHGWPSRIQRTRTLYI